uniref:Uncharacterized protein n=1 Tax=Arundo donax TaxID=35708 RepID=A0A0A9BFP1_ARUDO
MASFHYHSWVVSQYREMALQYHINRRQEFKQDGTIPIVCPNLRSLKGNSTVQQCRVNMLSSTIQQEEKIGGLDFFFLAS